MTAPADLDALARAADPARADSRALSAFLAGPVKASALEASSPDAPDPANVQRRRWGVGGAASTAVAAASTTTTSAAAAAPAPSTPGPSATTSWWQKTSWFAGASPDVDPVLADPTGADGGASGLSAPAPGAVGGAACQNRFTGPGQRDPIRPVTPGSVRVNPFDAAAVEDPGEVYGGHNARAGAGAAYRAVGGAMAHSRLSLQPRRSTPRGPRCADEFERGHSTAVDAAKTNGACAVASAAARPKYGFDFVRGVWEVEGTGAEVRARARRNQETTTTLSGSEPSEDSSGVSGVSGASSGSGSSSGDVESTRRALATAAKETRDARLTRFAAQHEAATEAARAARAFAAEARAARRALERKRKFASGATSRPPSSVSPLEPSERASERDRTPSAAAAAALAPPPKPAAASSSWRMLRLGAAPELGPVFVDAGEDGDVSHATLARWVAGDAPWPEMRVMELSREARGFLGVPAGAPGPVAPPALAEAARREIAALVAEEAAEANRAKDHSEDHGDPSPATRRAPGPSSAVARMPPGSTATPRQANIIDRLVEATGANRAALEDAAAAGKGEGGQRGGGGGGGGGGGEGREGREGAGEKATAALKDALRDAIREKHANLARAKNAEARVARLEAALASAGVPIPSDA